MSIVGCDLSTFALDLVKLSEDDNRAEWLRVELHGKDAWERTLNLRDHLRGFRQTTEDVANELWFEDVHLVAIEAPYGHGSDLLNRVVGAVAASLPAALRSPERCWIVRPDEYRSGLGLKGKPDDEWWDLNCPDPIEQTVSWPQDARDAYALAWWSSQMLAQAIEGAA